MECTALWDIKISEAYCTSMLPSKIAQMKASRETGTEAINDFGRALMPSYLGIHPPKAAFFSFRTQLFIQKEAIAAVRVTEMLRQYSSDSLAVVTCFLYPLSFDRQDVVLNGGNSLRMNCAC